MVEKERDYGGLGKKKYGKIKGEEGVVLCKEFAGWYTCLAMTWTVCLVFLLNFFLLFSWMGDSCVPAHVWGMSAARLRAAVAVAETSVSGY